MSTTIKRTAKQAFDIIREGLYLQKVASQLFIMDDDGNRDPFGFIIGDAVTNEASTLMGFNEINDTYLDGIWSNDACEVIELCQQIHDGVKPSDWDYHLGVTAASEGLNA